jgi:hypothetical protein
LGKQIIISYRGGHLGGLNALGKPEPNADIPVFQLKMVIFLLFLDMK